MSQPSSDEQALEDPLHGIADTPEGELYKWPGTPYPVENGLGGRLTATDSAVVDSRRAGLDLSRAVRLLVATDRPATLGLSGCSARPQVTGGVTVALSRQVAMVRFP